MTYTPRSTNDKRPNTGTIKFLSFQGSYKTFEVALFSDDTCIKHLTFSNKKASSILIPTLQKLLVEHSLSIRDIDFIALDQGPGAFTSLRVTITTANAISFATKTPLIGIDGLVALAHETKCSTENLVVLLNAFHNDVYYTAYSVKEGLHQTMPQNYKNIETLLQTLQEKRSVTVTFVGNGATAFENEIKKVFRGAVILDTPVASAKQIGFMALEKWNKKEVCYKLSPLYLKTQKFKPKYS